MTVHLETGMTLQDISIDLLQPIIREWTHKIKDIWSGNKKQEKENNNWFL